MNASALTSRWMVGCLVVGAGLRAFRLGHQSLWIDELISLQLATWARGSEFWRGLLIDIHGPFNSALLHGWARVSQAEAWLRLPYALISLATIPVAYVLVRDLFDERVGRITAWLLAISPFHIWYAQEVRSYSFAIFWATLALYLFLRIWDGRATRGTWIGLAATLAVSVLTNFSFVLLIAALSALAFFGRPFDRGRALRWCGVLLTVGLVFLPWFLDWFGRIGGERLFVNAPSPVGMPLREQSGFSFAELPYAVWSFAYGYSLGPSLRALHLDRSLGALLPYLPILVAGGGAVAWLGWLGLRRAHDAKRLGLVLALLGIPLLLAVVLALREIKTFHPRYLALVFPVFLALLGAGWAGAGRVGRAAGVVALVLVAWSLGQHYFVPEYHKEDSRSAAQIVAAQESPGDSVVVIYSFRPFKHYFLESEDGQARLHHVHKRFLRTDDEMRAHVAEASDGRERVWLVLSRWWDVAPEGQIRRIFEETLDERGRWEFPGIKVTLYDRRHA